VGWFEVRERELTAAWMVKAGLFLALVACLLKPVLFPIRVPPLELEVSTWR